jgi:hypothetical protein
MTEVPSDDSLIERLDEVVDDVLATDLAPPAPEDRWERRQRRLDSWTAIILAVAAVGATWASFQASQWSGAQSDAQSVSAIARSDSGRAASEATGEQIVDSQMWLSWLNAYANGQQQRADFFRGRFSPALSAAQDVWTSGVTIGATGQPDTIPPGTPMDLPSYVVPAAVSAQEFADRAEASLAEADVASSNATRFVLLAVLFALVLFFGSVATKFAAPKVQALLLLVAIGLLVFTVVRLLLLPQLL